MSARIGFALVTAAVIIVTTSGCTVHGPDAPPEGSAKPTSTEPTTPRPRDLALAGKPEEQLCGLLTPEQQGQLGVGRPSPDSKSKDMPQNSGSDFPGCGFLTPPGAKPSYSISFSAVPMPMREFKDQKLGPSFPETAATYTVAGFPAEQSQSNVGLENLGCSVVTDVADGQTLWTFFGVGVPGTMNNQDMCTKAKQAAEAAVTTLQGQG